MCVGMWHDYKMNFDHWGKVLYVLNSKHNEVLVMCLKRWRNGCWSQGRYEMES